MGLEDALRVVAARGRLMQETAQGAMLSVPLAEREAAAMLGEGLALAAVNGAASCVVSGDPESVERLQARLDGAKVPARRLAATRAFHSALMEPALARFEETMRSVRLSPPRIPVVSNLTGAPLTAAEATDPAYWARHLRGTVRFHDGLRALLRDRDLALLEVGPGRTLTSLATREIPREAPRVVLASMRHAEDHAAEDALVLREALARLWLAGAVPDWRAVHAPARRRVARLPAYPFERRRHWLDPARLAAPIRAPPEEAAPEEDAPAAAPAVPAGHLRPDLPTAYVAPSGPLEETLVALWEDLFGFRGIGARDDFFDLGGHSLLATQMVSRIRETFEVEIPLPRLFEARTVADLAAIVEAALREKLEGISEEEARAALERA
jgi:acyl transferase domain-containing protein